LRPKEATMRDYELMYITRPTLQPEQQEALKERVLKIIQEKGGELKKVDIWGKRKLGYPIKRETEGYYVVMDFSGDEALVNEIDRVLKITDGFLRFKILRTDHRKR
jgi:small subunit ribosomal protein S6